MAATLATLIGWLLFVALVLALGGVAARLVVIPRTARMEPGPAAALVEAAARVGLAGAALAPIALALVLLRQLLEFRDPFVPWQEDARLLLFGTAWGRVWIAAGALSLVCAAGFRLAAASRRAGWWIGAPAALALGVFPALTGHASGTGPLRWLTVPADVLHVWAAGFWVGGLAFVLYADRRLRRVSAPVVEASLAGVPDADPAVLPDADTGTTPGTDAGALAEAATGALADSDPAARYREAWAPQVEPAGLHAEAGALPWLVPAFSPLAVACVATLVLTGTLASWLHLPAPLAFLSGPWGRTLGLKLLLALVVFALGATNWRRHTPRLREPGGAAALRRTALVELAAAQLVLLVTALLVRTAP